MTEVRIDAEQRDQFGKGAARRLRRDHKVPGVIYSHGSEVIHVALPAHELTLALKTPNALLELQLDGGGVQLAIPKSIQRDPVRHTIEHVDLVSVKRGEKVIVEVVVHAAGKVSPGGVLETLNDTITVEAEATHIPSTIEHSIEGLEIGESVHAKDIVLPAGAALIADPELVLMHVIAPQTIEEEPAAEGVEGVEGAEGAEGVEGGEPAAPAADEG